MLRESGPCAAVPSARLRQRQRPAQNARIDRLTVRVTLDAEGLLNRDEQAIARRALGTKIDVTPATQRTAPAACEQRGDLARAMLGRIAHVTLGQQNGLFEQ